MARMLPPYISDDVKSSGEKRIFELLKNDPATRDWIVLHSLGLTEHVNRQFGEIDFVVLAPGLGVFCLEVKSGNVSMVNGVWKFTNRYGHSTEKTRGPFQQAQEGMFSLITAVKKRFGSLHRLGSLLYGYGVMFPDISFVSSGIEHSQWQIYERDSRNIPISQYIGRLSKNYFDRMTGRFKWFGKSNLPTIDDVNDLADFLRGDFEGVVSGYDRLSATEARIFKYTEEQIRCLDLMQDNPRCLFEGAAGTGKTMIAIESARRNVGLDKRVLFVCYNNLLGSWLLRQLNDLCNTDYLHVGTFHNLLWNIYSRTNGSSRSKSDPNDESFYTVDLPAHALAAINDGVIQPFDKLIVDEGQDLIRPEYLGVLDKLVKGGLENGSWEIYSDFERQAIYSPMSKQEMVTLLSSTASFARCKLYTNCRNTRSIGEEISVITGFDTPSSFWKVEAGVPVEYFFYDDLEQEIAVLESTLNKLTDAGIPMDRITILSPVKFMNSCASKMQIGVEEITPNLVKNPINGRVTFATIHSFKGLENSYIIISDISRIHDDTMNQLMYIGMSRAKAGLIVLADSRVQREFHQLRVRSLG